MQTVKFGNFEVPVLEKKSALGRYENWQDSKTEKRPDIHIARLSSEIGQQVKLGRVLAERDGWRILNDPFDPEMGKWYFENGRGVRRIKGGDFVSYVTCPSINSSDGAATAAQTTIQFVPDAISPLFAGAGASTGGQGGFWYVGRTIQYTVYLIGTTGATGGTGTYQLNVATSQAVTTGSAVGGVSAAIALANSQTNIVGAINGWVTCRALGTSGTVIGVASIQFGALFTTNVTNFIPASAPATATVDTTANSALNFLATFSQTTTNHTVKMVIWQIMN